MPPTRPQRLRRSQPPGRSPAINVIVVILDTLRRDHLGCYGNSWIRTPNLDRLAARSTVFDNAYVGSYPCMPAREDLWTGRLNFLWRGWSPLEWAEDDLVSMLQSAGKPSMLVTDHYHLWNYGSGNYHMSFSGTEFIRGQEMDNWRTDPDVPIHWPAEPSKLSPLWERYARNTAHRQGEEDYFPAQVYSRATQWIEDNYTLEDFFLLIDGFDPHEPFDPPKEYAELYDPGYEGESLVWPRYGRPGDHGYSSAEVNHAHALYCGEISLIDRWLGKFLEKVEERELLSNTVVIVTSDHGFLFGEHDWLGKHSPTLYQNIVHTPLILYHPAQPRAGKRSAELVQMMDIFPTVLEAVGVKVPPGRTGRSLLPLAVDGGADKAREIALFGVFGGAVYATDGEWVFVKRPVPENAPLNWYTLSHFNQWRFGQVNDVDVTRERLKHYRNGRFPTWYPGDVMNFAGPSSAFAPPKNRPTTTGQSAVDELYHITVDYEQAENVVTAHREIAERLRAAVASSMEQIEAPSEQLDRLGLRGYV